METCLAGGDEFRGGGGPLILERGPPTNPLFRAFFEAVQQAGYPLTKDVNGTARKGSPPSTATSTGAGGCRAARAYLHPVMGRPNLRSCRAFVTRILFDGNRAVGVEFATAHGPARRPHAGEVILCGGAINSPQLLQLSGVGTPPTCGALGVDAGRRPARRGCEPAGPPGGLRSVRVQAAGSVAPGAKWRNRPTVGARWLFLRSGPGATNHFEGGGFAAQQRRGRGTRT